MVKKQDKQLKEKLIDDNHNEDPNKDPQGCCVFCLCIIKIFAQIIA